MLDNMIQSIIVFYHMKHEGATFHLKGQLPIYFNMSFIRLPCLEMHTNFIDDAKLAKS